MSGERNDVVRRKNDLDTSREPVLRHEVDGSGLQLDQEHVCGDLLELSPESDPIRKIAGDMNDICAVRALEMRRDHAVYARLGGAEVRHRSSPHARQRSRPENRRDDIDLRGNNRAHSIVGQLPLRFVLGHRHDDEVGEE